MKKYILLQVVLIVFFKFSFAQSSETFILKPGEDLFEKHYNDVYKYPGFVPGKVYYTNGDSAGGRMNYNRFFNVIEFVDSKKDTLIFTPENIVYIKIAGDVFYYNQPEYLLHKLGSASCKLAVRENLKLKDVKKIGAFGLASSTSKIESLDQLRADLTHRLIANEEMVFSKENTYYVGNEKNSFLQANKKNILKLFPAKKKIIEAYLESHTINFQNETHLAELVNFIQNQN